MSKLDVCGRTQEDISRGGGTICGSCGWDVGEHRSERDVDKGEIDRLSAALAKARADLVCAVQLIDPAKRPPRFDHLVRKGEGT